MLRYALRGILARKARMLLTLIAIALGVAFLAGVLTFDRGLHNTFDGIVNGSTPDVVVRLQGADTFTANQPNRASLTPADIDALAALPGAAAAHGEISGYGVSLLDAHGKLVGGQGAPTLAFNHGGAVNLRGEPMMQLDHGRWPTANGEIVMDGTAADRAGYAIGDLVTIIAPTQQPLQRFRLVGTASFAGGGTAGAVLLLFDTPDAQRLFLGGRDAYTGASLTARPGVTHDELAAQARAVLPASFTAVTGEKVVQESKSTIDVFLGAISTFLTAFAGIAVLVCGLMIVNTFTIVVAQRTVEFAVLRALGASRAQLTRSVLVEATVMALVGGAAGVAGGWALARLLGAIFGAVGLQIRGSALTLSAPTAIECLVVGLVVTAIAAYLPARRAGRVPPVAAMRMDSAGAPRTRRRLVVGSSALAVATLAIVVGSVGKVSHSLVWVGVGGGLWIITVAALSGLLGWPVLAGIRAGYSRVFGAAGRLAGGNALRDPRRTGATASALMIGIALVCTVGVVAASMNRSVDDLVGKEFAADFVVEGAAYSPFPTSVGDRIASVPGVGVMARQQIVPAKLEGKDVSLTANEASFDRIYHLDMVAGTQVLGGNDALVQKDAAQQHGWHVGSSFTLHFAGGRALHLTVAGIAESTPVMAPISIPLRDLARIGIGRQDSAVSIVLAPGADASAVHRALDAAVSDLPIVSVQDKAEFASSIRGQVNQLLYLIYGLLALAVIIAIFGIVNTLSLSVVERTREFGLLRAIGTRRAQIGEVVTLESLAIAALGASFGLVLGVSVGLLLRHALASNITSVAVPVTQLLAFLVVAAIAGVVAAVAPAIRASRLNVLRAIATD